MTTRLKTLWMSLGAALGVSLMAIAAISVDAPSRATTDLRHAFMAPMKTARPSR